MKLVLFFKRWYGTVGKKLEKEVMGMCNLSDLIWEDGIERGIAQNKKEIALKMLRLGKTEREIFELTELSAEELEMLKNVQGK